MKNIFRVIYLKITKNNILLSLLMAYAISCNKNLPVTDNITLYDEIGYSLEGRLLLFYGIFLFSIITFHYFERYSNSFQIEFGITSCILSIFNVISYSFMKNNTLDLLYSSYFQICKMVIVFVGVFFAYYFIISYIYIYI